ncbi:hypothetical protein L1887_48388 [Cichorium endivia]|nr:hypothetical protein L1887_48388 [Cichorium endivia]
MDTALGRSRRADGWGLRRVAGEKQHIPLSTQLGCTRCCCLIDSAPSTDSRLEASRLGFHHARRLHIRRRCGELCRLLCFGCALLRPAKQPPKMHGRLPIQAPPAAPIRPALTRPAPAHPLQAEVPVEVIVILARSPLSDGWTAIPPILASELHISLVALVASYPLVTIVPVFITTTTTIVATASLRRSALDAARSSRLLPEYQRITPKPPFTSQHSRP